MGLVSIVAKLALPRAHCAQLNWLWQMCRAAAVIATDKEDLVERVKEITGLLLSLPVYTVRAQAVECCTMAVEC